MTPSESSLKFKTGRAYGLSALSEAARTQAWERFQVIRPFLQEGVPLPALARQHSISVRTARRWVQDVVVK